MNAPDVLGTGRSGGGTFLNELLLPTPVVTLLSVLGLIVLFVCACEGAVVATPIAHAS